MSAKKNEIHFVLGSSSNRRKELLGQIGVFPDKIVKPNIEENIFNKEVPLSYVKRMAMKKMDFVQNKYPESLILTADTVVAVGRRILPKTFLREELLSYLDLLSGRRHRVITAFSISSPFFKTKVKHVTSIVKFKRLTTEEKNFYSNSNEWKGKAGGYAIQGVASRYINFLSGSYSNVVGLPLSEVYNFLVSNGYKINNEKK